MVVMFVVIGDVVLLLVAFASGAPDAAPKSVEATANLEPVYVPHVRTISPAVVPGLSRYHKEQSFMPSITLSILVRLFPSNVIVSGSSLAPPSLPCMTINLASDPVEGVYALIVKVAVLLLPPVTTLLTVATAILSHRVSKGL